MLVHACALAQLPASRASKPRLLVVIRLLAGRKGGAERVFVALANALHERGYEVTAAYCEGKREGPGYAFAPHVTLTNLWDDAQRKSPAYRRLKSLSERPKWLGLHHLFGWLWRYLGFWLNLRRLIARVRPALVISFLPSANTVALLSSLGKSTKVLCTNHGLPSADYESPKRWDQNPVDRFLRKRMLWRAAGITVLFPSYRDYFGRRLKPRVHAIPNFLEAPYFERDAAVTPKRRIVASGRLNWEKNYACLIEAFAQLAKIRTDFELWIYGEGDERTSLEALVAQHDLSSRVFLPGHEPDLRERLREAYVFCHPALFEGFALSVAEALSQGVPAVAFSDCSGVNEYVVHEKNGLLVERAAGAPGLAQALLRLMDDASLRERLGARAPRSVEGFRPEVVLERWEQVISSLLE